MSERSGILERMLRVMTTSLKATVMPPPVSGWRMLNVSAMQIWTENSRD